VITAGFKRVGIYPFNSDDIDYGVCDDSANILSSDTSTIYSNSGNKNSPPPDTSSSQYNHSTAIFSPKQEQLIQRRFEEKYDLPDPVYQQWLMINHLTAEQVQEDQSTEAVRSAKEVIEVSLEKDWEEFENYDFAGQAYQEWLEINSPPQEEIQKSNG